MSSKYSDGTDHPAVKRFNTTNGTGNATGNNAAAMAKAAVGTKDKNAGPLINK